MTTKISQLGSAASVDGTELAAIVQGGTTKRTTLQIIADWVVKTSASFTQSGTGATSTDLQTRGRLTVWADDYGGDIIKAAQAITAAGLGGTIMLAAKTYNALSANFEFNDITVMGVKRPDFNSGGTGLENGSIVKGPFIFLGDNLQFRNFGVDSGSAVCTALYAGVGQQGLVCTVTQLSGKPQYTGLIVDNVIAICQSPSASTHAFGAEGFTRACINNVETVYGVHGQAYKLQDSQVTNIRSRGNSNEGVVIKSDATRQAKRCTFSGINVACYGAADTLNGIDIQAQGNQDVTDIVISDAICQGLTGSGFLLSSSAGSTISDITINSSHFNSNTQYGASHSGVCKRIKYVGCTGKSNTLHGFTDGDSSSSDISYTACDASLNANGIVNFGTRVDWVACTANSNTAYGFYVKTGATCYRLGNRGTGNGTALYGGDSGTATVFYCRQSPDAVTAPTLAGSWVNFNSSNTAAGYSIDDEGKVHLEGLVKSGSGTIFTLPAGFRPAKFVRFPVSTLSGATVTLGEVTISSGGVVNLAVGGTDYVALDGIHFRTYGSA